MEAKDRIIVALDVDSVDKAIALVRELSPHVGYFKIGLELIYTMLASLITPEDEAEAAEALSKIRELFGLLRDRVFLDTKLDDIPNTVAGASKAIVKMAVKMFNIHASAGKEAVVKAVANRGNSLVVGVTVLTSIGEEECISIFGDKPGPKVIQFAKMLSEVGANGIVCSPQELELLNQHPELKKLTKVIPGVRPEWAAKGDQKRVMTPYEAIRAGATYLVIGRPITQPPQEIGGPVEAAQKITEEIEKGIRDEGLEKVRKTLELKTGTPEELLEYCQAIWIYAAQEGEPHAILASGKHSDGYINLNAVLQFPNLCEILAKQLIEDLEKQGITREKINAVVSSSFAAITFGQEVARQLNVLFVFTEKIGEEQKWGGRFELPPGTRILQIEELITTLHTTRKVKEVVLAINPQVKFLDIDGKTIVATIVYRPEDLSKVDPDFKIIALMPKEIHSWDPDQCPLCQKGSLALKPKPNWQRFIEHR